MNKVKKIFLKFIKIKKIKINNKSNYIFYKIINYITAQEEYIIQCINTKTTFRSKINKLICDIDLLYGLHPIQACYIGIEYAKYLSKAAKIPIKDHKNIKQHFIFRYGQYNLLYQERNGKLCFTNNLTHEEFSMYPWEIALSEEFIKEFDAAQAFHIGYITGQKIEHENNDYTKHSLLKNTYLRIIK